MHRNRLATILALLSLLVVVPAAPQQDIYGSIAGTVTDPSGAVVPNAQVQIRNTDTNVLSRTLTTNASGNYSAPELLVGHYSVTVQATGFKSSTIQGIQLNVSDRLTENFQLSVGQQTESVTVSSDAVQVELQTAQPSGLISGTQVREIPLNNRNYEQLVALQPGVAYSGPDQLYVGATSPFGTNTVSFAINGQRTSSNDWTVDGADNVDRGSNLTLLTFPSVDAIAEFKTLRGNYTSEYGRSAGGTVNVITKSGTNAFHGDAYEFFRNDVLNANTFFNKVPAKPIARPPLRYNDFGYTIGGPVRIPGIYNGKDKTFFFFSQEYRRVITYTTALGTVPTAAERQGTFPNPVCTSVTVTAGTASCASTGTQIASVNPVAQSYLKDIINNLPLPNDPNNPNGLITSYRNVANDRQDFIRADHVFSQRFNVFYRYLHDTFPTVEPGGLFTTSPLPGVATTVTASPGKTHLGHATFSLTNTLLMDVGYAYSSGAIISNPTGSILASNSPDIKANLPFTSTLARVPSVTFSGGSPTASAPNLTSFGPYRDFNRNHNAFANATKIWGNHSIRFGATYHHYEKTENAGGNNAGTFAFTNFGKPTSSSATAYEQSFANFLSGYVSTFSQASLDLTPDMLANQFESYAQDEWRIRPNLTLNYGVRYSYFPQPTDGNRLLTTFDPRAFDPNKAPAIDANGNICTTAPCAGGVTPNPNYDPLNGIAVNGKSSRYGEKVGSEQTTNFAPRVGVAWDPFGTGKTSIRSGYGISYDATLFGIYEQNIFQNPPYVNSISLLSTPFQNPTAGTVRVSSVPLALHATDAHLKTPYSQQWSLDVQQELARNLLFDVGYYGSTGRHLLVIEDINQPLPNAVQQAGLFTPTAKAPFLTSATENIINAVRPYKGYGPINDVVSGADSNYHSLQTAVRYQFTGNSLVGLAYTWSHCMTDSRTDRSNAPQNTYNLRGEYGRCQVDRRNVFTANYVYTLPVLRDANPFLKYTLGGWEVSGVVAASTGLPLNPGTTANIDPAGQGLQLSSSSAGLRPDIVGDPNASAPHTFTQWFNTAAFQDVQPGNYRPGNSHPGSIAGPGFQRFDFSLYKNIPIHEAISAQFRAEAYNVFNHTNYDSVGTTLGSGSYGKITATRDPRIMQLALKMYF